MPTTMFLHFRLFPHPYFSIKKKYETGLASDSPNWSKIVVCNTGNHYWVLLPVCGRYFGNFRHEVGQFLIVRIYLKALPVTPEATVEYYFRLCGRNYLGKSHTIGIYLKTLSGTPEYYFRFSAVILENVRNWVCLRLSATVGIYTKIVCDTENHYGILLPVCHRFTGKRSKLSGLVSVSRNLSNSIVFWHKELLTLTLTFAP